MKCPYCGSENVILIKKKNKGFCDDCDRGFSIDQNFRSYFEFSKSIYKSQLKFDTYVKLSIFTDNVERAYPLFLSNIVKKIESSSSALEACNYCNLLYFWITRFFAFQCLCSYLDDEKAEAYYKIQESLSGLTHTYDSSWTRIISSIIEYYKTKEMDYPFKLLFIIMEKIFDKENGYKDAIFSGSIYEYEKKDLSLIQSAQKLRNILAHDKTIPFDEDLAEKVLPYYRDIVYSILKESEELLDGDIVKFIIHKKGSEFISLHANKETIYVDCKKVELESIISNTDVGVFNVLSGRFYPLYPFLVKIFMNGDELELFYDTKLSNEILYIGWKNNEHIMRKDGYNKLLDLLDKKELSLSKNRVSDIDLSYIIESSKEKSMNTLKKDYIDTKYIEECYVEPYWLEKVFTKFDESDKSAMMIIGEAGSGKSAGLANYCNKLLKESNNVIPLFLNGADISAEQKFPVASLLKEYLLLVDSNKTKDLLSIIKEFNVIVSLSENKDFKMYFLLDAVNEYYSPIELFNEIDEFIALLEQEKSKENDFGWVKFVFSIRKSGYDQILHYKINSDNRLMPYQHFSIVKSMESYYSSNEKRVIDGGKISDVEVPYVMMCKLDDAIIIEIVDNYVQYENSKELEIVHQSIYQNIELLRKPIILMIFIQLIQDDMESGFLSNRIFEEDIIDYFVNTLSKEEIDFLYYMCELMISHNTVNINYELVQARIMEYVKVAEINKNRFYRDPLERLLSANILKYNIGDSLKTNLKIQFVYQKISESVLKMYIMNQYDYNSVDVIDNLIEQKVSFVEYENAVKMLFTKIWNEGEIDLLIYESKSQKYINYIKALLYKDIENAVYYGYEIEEQKSIAIKYRNLFLKSKDLIKKYFEINEICQLFVHIVLELYYNKISSEIILDEFIQFADTVLSEMNYVGIERGYCLRYKGNRLKGTNPDKSLELYLENLDLLKKMNSTEVCNMLIEDTFTTYVNIGYLYMQQGFLQKAEEAYNEALKICEYEDESIIADKGIVLNRLGYVNIQKGFYNEAQLNFDESMNIFSGIYKKNSKAEIDYASVLNCMGYIYLLQHNYDKSEESYQNALEHFQNIYNENKDDYRHARNVALNYTYIGDVRIKMNDCNKAQVAYQNAIDIFEKLHNLLPDNDDLSRDVVIANINLGYAYFKMGKSSIAEIVFDKAIKFGEHLVGTLPLHRVSRDLALAYSNKAQILIIDNKLKEAEKEVDRALEIRNQIYEKDKISLVSRYNLVMSFREKSILDHLMGNSRRSEKYYNKALIILGLK